MDKNDILDKIFADDPLGILNEKAKATTLSESERAIESFKEIENFIAENGREPERNPANMSEFKLAARLKAFREDPTELYSLNVKDNLNLLPKVVSKHTIEDIFTDKNFLNLFDSETEENDIFTIKNVSSTVKRAETDFVARRKTCKDFEKYEEGFKQVHADLLSGERKFVKYENQELHEGEYYMHNGILFLLEKKNITQEESTIDGKRKRKDGRTRCIFENATESNMLYRSIAKSLYANGAIVSKGKTNVNNQVMRTFIDSRVDDNEKVQNGFIYILQSLSKDEYISTTKNLYKIGFCTTTVEERIKNAENEPTFLLAPVKIYYAYECINVNTQKLEKLLHHFFASACMDIKVTKDNKEFTAREWFALPSDVIKKAIAIILEDLTNNTYTITDYFYDKESEKLVRRR